VRTLLTTLLTFLNVFVLAGSAPGSNILNANGIEVQISDKARIVACALGPQKTKKALSAQTQLAGCREEGPTVSKSLNNGGVEFTKTLICDVQKRCKLTERFFSTADSIRWEIEIIGQGNPWSVPIQTQMVWPKPNNAKFWTAWGAGTKYSWSDPLVPQPFSNMELIYGGLTHTHGNAISLPFATVLNQTEDRGMALVLAPEDLILDMKLQVAETGEIRFVRTNMRISENRPIRFAMDLTAHPADWRAGLGWMVKRYPKYFDPPNLRADDISGCGAYSGHLGKIDALKMKKMGLRFNWG